MTASRDKLQKLIIDLLTDGKVVDVPVYGISMFPFFKPGTIVRVQIVSFKDIRLGDVIFFEANGKLILHRVVRKGEDWLQCKGDSMLKRDSVVNADQFMGMVVAWKTKRNFKSVASFSFRTYALGMVALHRMTGFFLWPLAVLWDRRNH